ncbi:hypothetical protein VP01_8333g1, partial [Puccinia sorghi]
AFENFQNDLVQDPLGRSQPLSVEAQVGVGLYQLAHGISIVFRFCEVGFSIDSTSFPSIDKPEDWCEILASFERRQGIPQVFGAIGGTHIPILMPLNKNWKSYINRKSWPSIVFQCVISGGGAGLMHDGRYFGYPSNINILLPLWKEKLSQ